jgi:hypothetical protein
MAGIDDVNRYPVIHTWSYKLADAAWYDSNQGNAGLVTDRRTGTVNGGAVVDDAGIGTIFRADPHSWSYRGRHCKR